MYEVISSKPDTKVAVVGGGVAGSTIALRLAELGIDTTLFEKGDGLVSGPPICHLHAGGNLYREISDQQCLTLLQQFIDTVKVYADCLICYASPLGVRFALWSALCPLGCV